MDAEQEREAMRHKILAESKFKSSNLKSALKHAKKAHRLSPDTEGISAMIMSFETLRVAAEPAVGDSPDWYKILQVEPFSHINTIKKQYRKLALVLHPDKNPNIGCEEAFKLVSEGFRVLSDKIRRKEYDMKLRIKIQEEQVTGLGADGAETTTFWTACSRCRLMHKFERKYLGHNLMCPNCKKSFEAVEVDSGTGDVDEDESRVRPRSERLKRKGVVVDNPIHCNSRSKTDSTENVEVGDETMTLAQMRLGLKQKADKGKETSKTKEKGNGGKENEETDGQQVSKSRSVEEMLTMETERPEVPKKRKDSRVYTRRDPVKASEIQIRGARKGSHSSQIVRLYSSEDEDLEIMAVEDSDFYDFDRDRTERSFKKGQVWAIYDDDDGMPRHYCVINGVVSLNPFEVEISWLDLHNDGNVKLISLEEMGFHVSCGRFKVSKITSVNHLNMFSHQVDCERAAREIYRIYPKKGSVWAVYTSQNPSGRDKRQYDIVVFLTSYSEMHGMSIAYLEKVDRFKTVFKRGEIGCHAISCLEKDDVFLLSHQIPARKLSGDQVPENLKECWELDPASLPPDLLK